jgi:hypothetical protein
MLFLRVDDYPFTKRDERWRHNRMTFTAFDEVVRRHVPSYMLAVIPSLVDDADVDMLANMDHVEVAMHGVRHDERFQNEFQSWETDDDVLSLLNSGLSRISSTNGWLVNKYVPPHNVLDVRTINALRSLHFTDVFGGPETERDVMVHARSIGMNTWVSQPPHLYGRSDEMLQRGSVDFIRSFRDDAYLTLHWTWETNIGLSHLDNFLSQVREHISPVSW